MIRRTLVVALSAMSVGFMSAVPAVAVAGDLDTSFSSDGKVTTAFFGDDLGAGVAVQSDGKIVVAGSISDRASFDFGVARYTTTGSLDGSFGGGTVRTDFGGGSLDQAFAVAIQSDGKIVVAGSSSNGINLDFALARYTSAGALDTTFSGDGTVTTDFGVGFGNDQAFAVAIQTDGKIVAGGSVTGTTSFDFALARYTSAGALDTTFSGDGKLTTDFASSTDQAFAVAIQTNGKIVAAGLAHVGSSDDFGVARYGATGTLDSTFSADGKQTTDFSGGNDRAAGLAIQTDGKIVAAGLAHVGSSDDFAVARYWSGGALDTGFSADGKQTTDFSGGNDSAAALAIQTDGKILAGGVAHPGATDDFGLARYTTGGALDTTFSGDGKKTTVFGTGDDQGAAVALQSDGKSIEAGRGTVATSDFALVRHDTAGVLDPAFDVDGKVTTDFDANIDQAFDVAIQANARIVAAGSSSTPGDFALDRYNTDGSLDDSFGGDGRVTTDEGFELDVANSVAIQGDGKIVAAGIAEGGLEFAVVRYNPDGSLDTSFGGGFGIVKTSFGIIAQSYDMAIQSDGKIVVVGYTGVDGAEDFAIARYTTSGSLDTTFSGDGKVTTDFTGDNDRALGVAIQSDGKIVLAGRSDTGSTIVVAVARYTTTGSLDTTFSGDGKLTADFFAACCDVANSVAIQADGKIVAGGEANTGLSLDFAVARFTTAGLLDTSFSGDGKQTTDFGSSLDEAFAIVIQGDGKIVGVGRAGDDFALARYTTVGTLDTTFSGDGKVTTDFGGVDLAEGAVLQLDGKIVAAGTSPAPGTSDFALARYLTA